MKNSGIKSIAVNTAYLSSARALTSIARAVYAILLAKFLGAKLYGIFNYGLSWYLLFLPISIMGLDTILLREIGLNRDKASLLVSQTLSLRSVSSVTISIVCFILGWFFESNALLQTLLFIFSFALFGRGVSLWVNTIFKAHEASEYVLYQESIFRLLEVILGITLLNLGYGIVPLALVHSCLWVIQGAVGIILLKKYTLPFQMNWDGMVMINYMIKGIPFILSAFLISWIFQGPLILFRHSSGIGRDMGYVALALQAFFIISAVVAELGGAATPVVSRSVNRKDGKSDHYIDAVLRFGIFIGSLLVLASMSIADPMINFFLGADYSPVLKLLPFSLVLVTPYFWITSLRSIIVAHGRYWIIALNYLVGAVFFTISFYVFIEPLKHLGIMAALGLGLLMVAVMHLLTISKLRQEIDLMSSIIKPLIGMFISIAFCIAFCPVNPWISFIACTVLFFLLELILGGIKKHEILTVFKIVSGIKIFAK